jgi:hypothetical protein
MGRTATRPKRAESAAEGLSEISPPPRSNGRAPAFSAGQIEAVAAQIKRTAKSLSDQQLYKSRSSANWKAESLIELLREAGVESGGAKLCRRTWADGEGFRWAIKLEKKGADPG